MMPPRAPRGEQAERPAGGCQAGDGTAPRGIALLMALAVVMLLTMFMSEFFFATGLELRGMTTFKEAEQARALARSVFRVVQIGLMQDEVEFFKGYRQVEQVLQVAAVPWERGLLLQLDVAPQDHLYNLNELNNLQQGEDKDRGRWNLFRGVMEEIEVPGQIPEADPEPLTPETIAALYATFFDWIDGDDEEYIEFPSVRGAEADAYFDTEPEITIKNGMLDRLDEIRLVRGVGLSRIPWRDWRDRFTVLPRSSEGGFFYPESINVNIASGEKIEAFIRQRKMDSNLIDGTAFIAIQDGINKYVDQAEQIAERLAPAEGEREAFDQSTLAAALKELGFTDNYGTTHLFSTVNQYYRISVVTEVNEVQSTLEALLHIPRDKNSRTGTSAEVVWLSLR